MKVKIKLLSNAIFGSGKSIPGGEDISVLTDDHGFPYLRASTFKGILREELENLADWKINQKDNKITKDKLNELFGEAGAVDDGRESGGSLIFSDFTVPISIKARMNEENMTKEEITDCFTFVYTFTSLENGVAKKHSLRSCRYINKGMIFYGEIKCRNKDEKIVQEGLEAIKYIGTMKTRGFGEVEVSVV